MDRITASILDGFKTERSLDSLPRSELFESFAGYCVISNEYDDEFDSEDYRLGSSVDLGIDVSAIIVNGEIVSDKEEVRDLREAPASSPLGSF